MREKGSKFIIRAKSFWIVLLFLGFYMLGQTIFASDTETTASLQAKYQTYLARFEHSFILAQQKYSINRNEYKYVDTVAAYRDGEQYFDEHIKVMKNVPQSKEYTKHFAVLVKPGAAITYNGKTYMVQREDYFRWEGTVFDPLIGITGLISGVSGIVRKGEIVQTSLGQEYVVEIISEAPAMRDTVTIKVVQGYAIPISFDQFNISTGRFTLLMHASMEWTTLADGTPIPQKYQFDLCDGNKFEWVILDVRQLNGLPEEKLWHWKAGAEIFNTFANELRTSYPLLAALFKEIGRVRKLDPEGRSTDAEPFYIPEWAKDIGLIQPKEGVSLESAVLDWCRAELNQWEP